MATTVTLTSGGNLATALSTLHAGGGGDLILGAGTYTGGVDIDNLAGPIRIRGSLGPTHTIINGPAGGNCISVANMTTAVTFEGVTLNGPTTNSFATLYGVLSYGVYLDDCVLTAGGNGCVVLDRVDRVWAGHRTRIHSVPGVTGNNTPIGFWLFRGSGNTLLMIPDLVIEDVAGIGFLVDAGSDIATGVASTRGGQIGNLRLINVATHTSAAGGFDCQSGADLQIANLYVKGTAAGPAAISIKEDQYYGAANVVKPRNIQIGQAIIEDIAGVGAYFSGAHNCRIGSLIGINVNGRIASFVGGTGGGAGGGTDHTCKGNVIDVLDATLSPGTTGILFDSTDAAVTANTIRYLYPDGLTKTYSGSASRTTTTRNTVKPF